MMPWLQVGNVRVVRVALVAVETIERGPDAFGVDLYLTGQNVPIRVRIDRGGDGSATEGSLIVGGLVVTGSADCVAEAIMKALYNGI